MLNIVCYSKNRACQLELLLRSMNKFWKHNHQINVLYTYTDDEYEKGYDILIDEYKNINFVLEKNFKKDTLFLIDNNKTKTG